MNVYFDKEETEFVKDKGRGFVRGLVRDAMTGKSVDVVLPDDDKVWEEPDIRTVVRTPSEVRGPRLKR